MSWQGSHALHVLQAHRPVAASPRGPRQRTDHCHIAGADRQSRAARQGRAKRAREAAPSYGGCDVKRAWLIVARESLWFVCCVVAARGAVRASAGFATAVNLICGGWVPQDLVSSHVRCLDSSAATARGLLKGRARTGVRECREARAASPAATGCRWFGLSAAVTCFESSPVIDGLARAEPYE
jgi:hypothetical protein